MHKYLCMYMFSCVYGELLHVYLIMRFVCVYLPKWMTTIRNQSKVTDCKVDSKVDTKKDTIVRERESIKMWISKELGSMKTGRG